MKLENLKAEEGVFERKKPKMHKHAETYKNQISNLAYY